MARSYRELLVWQKAKALAVHTYAATADFPRCETYGITSQIRRASVSVTSDTAVPFAPARAVRPTLCR